MPRQPTQQQEDIYAFIAQHAPISPAPSFQVFQISGGSSTEHLVAYTKIGPASAHATLAVSLPTHSNQVYIAITDDFHPEFCDLVARFDAESETNDALNIHMSLRLRNPFFNQVGWYGVLFAHVSELIESFPEKAIINNEQYSFQLIIYLTQNEFEFAQRRGSITLLQQFYYQRRNFLKFIQPEWIFIPTDIKPEENHQPLEIEDALNPRPYLKAIRSEIERQKEIKKTTQIHTPAYLKLLQKIRRILDLTLRFIGTHEKSKGDLKVIVEVQNEKSPKKSPFISNKMLAVGEIILGSSLLIGGFFIGVMLLKTHTQMAGVFPILFGIVGVIILTSAFQNRKRQ